MLGIKLFSKAELVELMGAAGMSYADIHALAVANLRKSISSKQETIAENKAIIQKAEVAITDATAQLKAASDTLKIANKLGG